MDNITTSNEKIVSNKKRKQNSKQQLIDSIFEPNKDGISEWKTRDELSNTGLALSNNGNSRYGKYYNDTRYIWECKRGKARKVIALRTNGFDIYNNKQINKRSIRKDIKEYHYKSGCVVCGSKSKKELVVDHKNDLYNDPRVLNVNTQNIYDFQCLCTHCNLQKRAVCKLTRDTKKRYGATNIPQLKIFGIDFIDGSDLLNVDDKNAMVGTYWYDPVAFMEHIYKMTDNKLY